MLALFLQADAHRIRRILMFAVAINARDVTTVTAPRGSMLVQVGWLEKALGEKSTSAARLCQSSRAMSRSCNNNTQISNLHMPLRLHDEMLTRNKRTPIVSSNRSNVFSRRTRACTKNPVVVATKIQGQDRMLDRGGGCLLKSHRVFAESEAG